MTERARRFITLFLILAIGLAAAALSAVITQRQVRLRGALDGFPDPNLPARRPILGVNVELTRYTPDELDENLDLIAETGFVWVRQTFAWDIVEAQPGKYDWDAYDAIVAGATGRGLRLIAVLERSPGWAASTPAAPPGDLNALAAFAGALAERYGESIDVYQVWDEPNLTGGWGGPPDPIDYITMLQTVYLSIHNADEQAMVLTAGLAPTIETGPDNLSDILYLRALYENGAAPFFDGVAGKPYGFDSGPDDRRVDPNLTNFSRFILLREEMERYGDGGKPLWGSHFGWNSLPADWTGEPSIWGQVTAGQQTEWTVAAYRRALDEWPWAGGLILAYWQPDFPVDDPHWGFALRDADGTLSPAVQAIAKQADLFNQALWPGAYPPQTPLVTYSGEWEFSDLGADFGEANDSVVEVPFAGDSLAVIARRDNYRAYLFVTVDGQPSASLPQNEHGAYVILTSPDYQPTIDVLPVAGGLSRSTRHLARIEADRGWDQWALVGFVVGSHIDTRGYDWSIGGLIALLAVLGILAWRSGLGQAVSATLGDIIRILSTRLSQGMHLALSMAAALAVWLGMAITWGGLIPTLLRKAGDGPSLVVTLLTAGVFYFSPWLLLTIVALIALFILIYARPATGVALMMFFTPYYLLPRPLFDRAFSLLEVTTLFVLAAWGIRVVAERRRVGWPSLAQLWRQMTALDKAVLCFIGLAVVSISWADLKGVAVTELRQMVLEPAVAYLVLRTLPFEGRERRRIIDLLMATGVMIALYGFYQFFIDWRNTPAGFTCLRSTFGTCNNAALYLERLIPISAAIVLIDRDRRRRWVYGIAGGVMLAATVLTVSRGGLLFGLPAAVGLVIILWAGRRGAIVVGIGLALEVLALIPLSMFVPRFRDMLDLSSSTSSSFFRTQVWQSALRMIQDHPITGVGLDQFLYQYRGRYILPDAWQQPNLSQPHNFLLDYWIRLGVLGLAIGLWMQVAFWRLAWSTQRRLKDTYARALCVGLMGGMAAMIAHGMVDETHFVIDLAFIFFMSLGLVHQLAREAESDSG
ncbi:MAG: O-antigen ligase family protein [Anaerolineae bacterium]|nr:O-antigen ligase family protein [Anaerolineae bacterium]